MCNVKLLRNEPLTRASFFSIGETICPEIVLFTDVGCIWTEEVSADVGIRQGVDTEAACGTIDSVFADNVPGETCSVELMTELEDCRTDRMRSNKTSVFRHFSTCDTILKHRTSKFRSFTTLCGSVFRTGTLR